MYHSLKLQHFAKIFLSCIYWLSIGADVNVKVQLYSKLSVYCYKMVLGLKKIKEEENFNSLN